MTLPAPPSERIAAMVDAALADRRADLALRAQMARDLEFIDDLAATGSPLAGMLPEHLIRQQAEFQRLGHDAAYPDAMQRIVIRQDRPVGRIALDWAPDLTHCIDIAIVPALRGLGVGTALLESWLMVADQLEIPAALHVRVGNPAIALYRRLGLTEIGDADGPIVTMVRAR